MYLARELMMFLIDLIHILKLKLEKYFISFLFIFVEILTPKQQSHFYHGCLYLIELIC